MTSDHGEAFFERGVWVGHGFFLFDTEIRVPLIMKLPAALGLGGIVVDDAGGSTSNRCAAPPSG